MRKNPLLQKPPVPSGRGHRLGSMTERSVRDLFRYVDPAVLDLYEGVHVTPHPIVAAAYALNRRRIAYNDLGMDDVIIPPVLIGLRVSGPEHLDADGYVTAKAIEDFAEQLEKDGVTSDDERFDYELAELEEDYSFGDNTRPEFFEFDPDMGLAHPGGEFGNRADYADFVSAVRQQLAFREDPSNNEYDLLRNVLKLAQKIIPQSRIIRDVFEDEVAAIIVLAPYVPSRDDRNYEDMPSPPFESLDAFEGMSTPEAFDRQLLTDATVIYGDPRKANRWHGTNLVTAAEALPSILTRKLVMEAERAGSAYKDYEVDETD